MKNLNILLKDIAELSNMSTTKEDSIKRGLDYYLELEYSSAYGGYRLVNVSIVNGSHRGAFGESSICPRRSLKAMTAYLEGVLAGIKTKNN